MAGNLQAASVTEVNEDGLESARGRASEQHTGLGWAFTTAGAKPKQLSARRFRVTFVI